MTIGTWPNDSAPLQRVPLTSSTERMHILEVHHMGQLRPGDRVAVDDPALAEVQRILREALGEDPPPNNEGTVEQAWDDGTLLIFFDDGGSAPYPATDTRRIA